MSKIRLPVTDKESLLILTIAVVLVSVIIINLTTLLPLVWGAYRPEQQVKSETLIDAQIVNEALKHIK